MHPGPPRQETQGKADEEKSQETASIFGYMPDLIFFAISPVRQWVQPYIGPVTLVIPSYVLKADEEKSQETASDSHLDLIFAPYVLYGVKYIDLVPLAPFSGRAIPLSLMSCRRGMHGRSWRMHGASRAHIIQIQNGATSGFEMYFGGSTLRCSGQNDVSIRPRL